MNDNTMVHEILLHSIEISTTHLILFFRFVANLDVVSATDPSTNAVLLILTMAST